MAHDYMLKCMVSFEERLHSWKRSQTTLSLNHEALVNSRVHSCRSYVTPVIFTYKVTSRFAVLLLFSSDLRKTLSLTFAVMTEAKISCTSGMLLSQNFNNKRIISPLPTPSCINHVFKDNPSWEQTLLKLRVRKTTRLVRKQNSWQSCFARHNNKDLQAMQSTFIYTAVSPMECSRERRKSKPHPESANVKGKLQQSPASLTPCLNISSHPRLPPKVY